MIFSKYTRLGILIVVSVAILIWGLSYLKGNDVFKRNDYYYVVYERVDGLLESNKVIINGYQVGNVKEINFLPGTSGKLIATLMIDESFRIPVNSVAQIVSSDIMGTRSVKLILSEEMELYNTGDTLAGAIESDLKEQVSMQVLPIRNKAEQLLGTIDSAITVLTVIFNEDARQNLSESFANINQTIENIEKTTADLQIIVASEKENLLKIINNLEEITGIFKENSQNIDQVITNVTSFSDTLSQLSISPIVNNLKEITGQLQLTLEKLNRPDNTAGLLLTDDELYQTINQLTIALSSLISDVQANPKRYVHFSAIDLGKEVYVNTKGTEASGNILFKVHLISTEQPISLESELFSGFEKVEEYNASGAYSYLTGSTGSYEEILEIHNKALKKFPDATIVSFKNGRLIKLERALNSLRY